MKQFVKRAGVLLLALAMMVAAAACNGSGVSAFDATKYIQGLMDKTYKGEYEDYMDLVNITENECEDDYISGMETEAEYLAYLYEIENLTDDMKAELVDIYKEIYAKSKYTVDPATKVDDKTYSVKVTVEPVDLIRLVDEALENGANDAFWDPYMEMDVASMSDEEYENLLNEIDEAWGWLIINLLRENLPNAGYLSAKSMLVQVSEDDSGWWGIPDDDFYNLDRMLIDYN